MILATSIFLTITAAQPLPPDSLSDGTCIVVYEIDASGLYRIAGVDIRTQSVLLDEQAQNLTLLTTPSGKTLRSREGETGFTSINKDQAYSLESATQQFPFLIPAALARISPDRIESSRTLEGGWDVTARLVMGDLNLTILGYEPPGGPKDVLVRYVFDETGRLRSTKRGDGETQIIEYADAKHSELAPSLPRNHDKPGGMRVASVETYIPGRPDLFEPDAVLPLVQKYAFQRARNEQEIVADILSTKKGQAQLRESHQPDNGIFGWRSNRIALILSGLVVIGIGGFAWWKNR